MFVTEKCYLATEVGKNILTVLEDAQQAREWEG
jgi:hypothetical protein